MRAILFGLFLLFGSQVSASATEWKNWQTVGKGQLTWGFWVIYDSELRTPSGTLRSEQGSLALLITYRRNIDKKELLGATDDQWQHLGIPQSRRTLWLAELDSIWPDIQKGDQLTFVYSDEGGTFYQSGKKIGGSIGPEFAKAFIDIWLSPETAYPKLRMQLIGRN